MTGKCWGKEALKRPALPGKLPSSMKNTSGGICLISLKHLKKKKPLKENVPYLFKISCEAKVMSEKKLNEIILAELSTTDLCTAGLARQISTEFKLSKKQVSDIILKLNQE